jgi:hypothetical protein
MPKSTVPSGRPEGAFTLTEVRGKVVDSIKLYQMEERLNLDIDFNDNTTLEIVARSASERLRTCLSSRTEIPPFSRAFDRRYVRLSDTGATRTIVTAMLRGRSFNRVQQAFLSGITN